MIATCGHVSRLAKLKSGSCAIEFSYIKHIKSNKMLFHSRILSTDSLLHQLLPDCFPRSAASISLTPSAAYSAARTSTFAFCSPWIEKSCFSSVINVFELLHVTLMHGCELMLSNLVITRPIVPKYLVMSYIAANRCTVVCGDEKAQP